MKSLIQYSLFIAFMSFASCEKPPDPPRPGDHPNPPHKEAPTDLPEGVPACIQDEIKRIQSEPVTNPPASIWQFRYHEQLVYYIPPKCCDEPGKLMDEKCNFMCSPDGGITGKGDGKCTDFFDTRTIEQLVWKDER